MKTQAILKRTLVVAVALLSLVRCTFEDGFYSNLLRSDVFVQLYDDSKYDILWVFDNSGSMTSRRQFVVDNMQTFLTILNSRKAVDFQMAVTTTDMFSTSGNLIAANSGLRVVKSATSSNPVADFASIVANVGDSPTSFWEQGLESAYQAITNHKSEFSRQGVPLIVIILTDENDFSCQDNCFGIEPENNPNDVVFDTQRYIDYFSTVKKSERTELYLFPIIGLSTSNCTVASLGDRYVTVQEGVGGLSRSGSICSSDLAATYQGIARIISDRGMVFPLSSRASGAAIKLYVDGKFIAYDPANYLYDAESNSIVFTGAVPKTGSVIEVTYDQSVGQ
jgi:hypothetical protein